MRVERVVLDTNVLNDNKLLEASVAGRADCLVTGDQDLLVLNPFRGIPILTPTAFLALVSRNAGVR